MIDFENYERVTRRNEHSHGILKDVDMGDLYSNLSKIEQITVEYALDRLAELEDRIEDGTLVFIDEPFYAKSHQCYGVYQKRGDVVETLFMTEAQAKTYKDNRALYYGKEGTEE